MAVIELRGQRQAAVNQTNACGKCEYTEASVAISKRRGNGRVIAAFPSEEGATEAYEVVREQLINEAWDKAWGAFRCANNACRNKDACNQQLKYLIAHTETIQQGKKIRFQVQLTIGREIRCVAPAGNNPDPTIPEFRLYEGGAQVPEDLPPVAFRETNTEKKKEPSTEYVLLERGSRSKRG